MMAYRAPNADAAQQIFSYFTNQLTPYQMGGAQQMLEQGASPDDVIAAGIKMGLITPEQAAAAGFSPSDLAQKNLRQLPNGNAGYMDPNTGQMTDTGQRYQETESNTLGDLAKFGLLSAGAYGLTNLAGSAVNGLTNGLTNAAATAAPAAEATGTPWYQNLSSEFGGTAATGSDVAAANAATAGSANASRLIQMGVPAATAATAAAAMDKSGIDLSKLSSSDLTKAVQGLTSGTSITDILKSLGTAAVQTAPYLSMDPGNSKAGDYMTNAGWRPQDAGAVGTAALNAAGFKQGGIGAMPQTQNQEYNRFLGSLENGSINDNPYFKSFNQQGQQATERALQARGMNQSTNLLYGLQNNANANFASFVPQFGNTLLQGAQQETSNWNTQNNANLQAGNLANNFFQNAMSANNNAATTGLNQMAYDVGMADRFSGLAGKTASSIAQSPYTYAQFANINTTGKS